FYPVRTEHHAGLRKILGCDNNKKSNSTKPAQEIHGDSCGNSGLSETPQNGVRGGSRVTRGKRSVFPERYHSTQINVLSKCVTVYGVCVNNNLLANSLVK